MSETGPRILLYALVAGLSPLALLATLAVLGSGRGRANGSAFGVGFLISQSAVLLIAILVGSAATPNRERGHETFAALLELALGLAPRGSVPASRERRRCWRGSEASGLPLPSRSAPSWAWEV